MEAIVYASDLDNETLDLARHAVNGVARSSTGVQAYFLRVGPELAKRIRATYPDHYRKFRDHHSAALAKDMTNDDWHMNGAAIRLTPDHLIDGNHRLGAVEKSGKFIEFLFVDNLPEEVYPTIDTDALLRNFSDLLRSEGYKNTMARASVVRLLYRWDKDFNLNGSTKGMTIATLSEIHRQNDKRIGWAVHNAIGTNRKIVGVPQSLLTLSLYVVGQINETSIKEMLFSVADGMRHDRGMPAKTLLDKLNLDQRNNRERTNAETLWLIFRAWKTFDQNTRRPDNNQLTLDSIPYPRNGITTRDLKDLLASD